MSNKEGIDLSKPLTAGEKRVLYVVHKGTFMNDKAGQSGIANTVCTRTKKEDAQSIADLLNNAQEGVFYLRFVASNGFPMACGDADALSKKAEEESLRVTWERIAAPLRKELYTVAEVVMVEDADAKEFTKVLEEETQAAMEK